MRQDIHAETPLYKATDLPKEEDLHGFEYLQFHADQNFLEALRSSALYDQLPVPDKGNKHAFAKHLEQTFTAAYTHNLNAVLYLTQLMTSDNKTAHEYDLYRRVGTLMVKLRQYHMKHIHMLLTVTNNSAEIYSDEMQAFAHQCLKNFLTLGDGYSRELCNEHFSFVTICGSKLEGYLNLLMKLNQDPKNCALDLIKHVTQLQKQFPAQADYIINKVLGNSALPVRSRSCELEPIVSMRSTVKAPFVLEMIATDIEQNYKWKVKPELINHLRCVLAAFGDFKSDIYGLLVAKPCAEMILQELYTAMLNRSPMLPETKTKYQEYRKLLQLVNDSNLAPAVVENENDVNSANDIEMQSQFKW